MTFKYFAFSSAAIFLKVSSLFKEAFIILASSRDSEESKRA
jgi:hypothetical protein